MVEVGERGAADRVERAHHEHAVGSHLLSLLGRRPLGHSEQPRGASRDRRGERNGCVDEDLPGLERLLQVGQVLGLRAERNREEDDRAAAHGLRVLESLDGRVGHALADSFGGLGRALRAARPDHDGHALAGEPQRQAEAERPCAADDWDGGGGVHELARGVDELETIRKPPGAQRTVSRRMISEARAAAQAASENPRSRRRSE